MWTGVWVKDILEHVGIKSFEEGGKHVCFVGADKLPNGYYGTSIRREVRNKLLHMCLFPLVENRTVQDLRCFLVC